MPNSGYKRSPRKEDSNYYRQSPGITLGEGLEGEYLQPYENPSNAGRYRARTSGSVAAGAPDRRKGAGPLASTFNDLYGELSGISGLEGFGNLVGQGGDASMADIQDSFNPFVDQYLAELFKPKDANLNNSTIDSSIIPIYEDGGGVGEVELRPIQTEEDEIAVLPDLTITNVKSDTTHDKMEKDDVTDILPGGSFIFSNEVFLNRETSDVTFGYSPPHYEEVDNDTDIKEVNFNVLFKDGEKELSTAELANRIKDKYKVNDQEEGNMLTNSANTENKISRMPYLGVLAKLTEEEIGDDFRQVESFKKGGLVKPKVKNPVGETDKAFGGIGLAIAAGSVLWDIGSTIVGNNKRKRQLKKDKAKLEEFSDLQEKNLDSGTLSTLASLIGQDPTFNIPDSKDAISTYKQQFDRTPQHLKNYGQAQINRSLKTASDQIFKNAPNFSTASANLAGVYAEGSKQQSNLAFNQGNADISIRNNYLRGLTSLRYQSATNEALKLNNERTGTNQQLSGVGAASTNYFNQNTANAANKLQTEFALTGNYNQAQQASNNALTQNIMGAASIAASIPGKQGDPRTRIPPANPLPTMPLPPVDPYGGSNSGMRDLDQYRTASPYSSNSSGTPYGQYGTDPWYMGSNDPWYIGKNR